VWLVKGKAAEDSQHARQEVLLPAYRVTGKPEVTELLQAGRRLAKEAVVQECP